MFLGLIIFKVGYFSFFNRDVGTHNFQSEKAIESITSGGFFGKGNWRRCIKK